ncbi:chemotaxis protein [Bartonella sp. M0283]|uniref:chemotaxis protein n=1 Tax=Bartonella sp. M0283 TaxID=2751016 RepID=UPI0018DE06EF|nr:chemotaxis protein [Bartonella sp. M0283]MBI0163350.1 chemotaxis protein [Bartonella sp. M0283]
MINRFFKVMCLAGVVLPIFASTPLEAQLAESALGPVQLVRSLESLQDDIASGQPGALQMQPRVLADIGQKFLSEDPSTWENAQNTFAALTYLFNGGNPDVVETILKNAPDGIVPKNYIDGARAYAHHKKDRFLKAFDNLPEDDSEIPAALLLSITLSTVADMAEASPEKASDRLNWVRLAAPGSLFEEAAIRRQIKVASMTGDLKLLRLLTRNYVTRFSKSPYANEFWRDFATTLPLMDNRLDDQQLSEFINFAPKTIQLVIYLKISRTALIDARMARAHFGAEKALDIAHSLNVNDASARLYYAASSVGSTAAEDAGEMLKTISVNELPEKDRPLLMAAKAVAKGVVLDTSILPKQTDDDEEDDDDQSGLKEAVGVPVDQVGTKTNEPLPMPTNSASGKQDEQKTSGEIDQFMQQTQKKIDDVDKLLEKK